MHNTYTKECKAICSSLKTEIISEQLFCRIIWLTGCSYENSFFVVFRLTRKKIIFHRVYFRNISPPGQDSFCRDVRWENFANNQNGWDTLKEKLLSFVVFEHIKVWYTHFMFRGSSALLEIERQKPWHYKTEYVFFTNIKAKIIIVKDF